MSNEPQSSPVKNTTKTSPKKSKNSRAGLFSFLLTALAIIGILFLWQQNVSKTKSLKKIRVQIETIKLANTKQNTAQQTLQLAVAQIQSQQNKLSTYQNWNIAGYLVRLAHIEFSLLHNPQQTQTLLVSADAALAADESPRSRALKTAINNDMNHLNKLFAANTQATLGEINALSQQIANLSGDTRKQFHPAMPQNTFKKGQWWQNIKHSLKDFENLVVIRHNKKPIQPLLEPENLELLKAAIRIQLGLAQWALISEQTQTYEMSLQSAASWLTQYTGQNNQAQLIAKQLVTLSKKPVIAMQSGTLESWQVWQKLDKES